MPYKILLIDADHTLFDFDQSEEIAFKSLLKQIKLEKDFSTLFPVYMDINRKIWEELHAGSITQKQLKTERFQRFTKQFDLEHDPQQLSKAFTKHLSNASILFDKALHIIEVLSKKYRIALVTNGLKEVQTKRVRQSVLSPFVELTVISDEIGISKPDPAIIDYTLKKMNHPNKSDVIIIGDNLHSDILCGFNAGIDTVWYNPKNTENTLDKNPTYTIRDLEELLDIL
jgi:putative hydrolase of the HAD superfamily